MFSHFGRSLTSNDRLNEIVKAVRGVVQAVEEDTGLRCELHINHRALYILTRALTPRYIRIKVLKPCGRIHVYVQTNTKA